MTTTKKDFLNRNTKMFVRFYSTCLVVCLCLPPTRCRPFFPSLTAACKCTFLSIEVSVNLCTTFHFCTLLYPFLTKSLCILCNSVSYPKICKYLSIFLSTFLILHSVSSLISTILSIQLFVSISLLIHHSTYLLTWSMCVCFAISLPIQFFHLYIFLLLTLFLLISSVTRLGDLLDLRNK